MNKLEQNLIDNILECRVKLGDADTQISFYFPLSSLAELLECSPENIDSSIREFRNNEQGRLGFVQFEECSNEKGRYAVTIPLEGINWVQENYQPSDFMKDFINEIRKPANTFDNLIKVFHKYSPDIDVKDISATEHAICFRDMTIDPYVYYIEQNMFGLEYHRFTRESFKKLIDDKQA